MDNRIEQNELVPTVIRKLHGTSYIITNDGDLLDLNTGASVTRFQMIQLLIQREIEYLTTQNLNYYKQEIENEHI